MNGGQPRRASGRSSPPTGSGADRDVLDRMPSSDWPQSRTVSSTVMYSRRLSDDPIQVDVEATIPPLLADIHVTVPSAIAAQSARAERDLALLDSDAEHLEPDVVEAVTTSLLRAESLSSSRIEGLQISNRRLSEAFYDPAAAKRLTREVARSRRREVANNTTALHYAIELGSHPDR